jgi:hypothetical protein
MVWYGTIKKYFGNFVGMGFTYKVYKDIRGKTSKIIIDLKGLISKM